MSSRKLVVFNAYIRKNRELTKLINQNKDLQKESKYKERSKLKTEMKYTVMKISKCQTGYLKKD